MMPFWVMTACVNNQAGKNCSKPNGQYEKYVDTINKDKKTTESKTFSQQVNDSLFVRRIIDGSFFDEEKSETQDYALVISHCLCHTDEQYDEAFADGLCRMLQKYPGKFKGLQAAMDVLTPAQRKKANDNMIAYIVSSWAMEQTSDQIDCGAFYKIFPLFNNNPVVDSIMRGQCENYGS